MVIFMNGRYLPEHEAKIGLLEPGLLFGFGLFETVRAYRGRIFAADLHWERLLSAARELNLRVRLSPDQITETCQELLSKNTQVDGAIRVSLYKGRDDEIIALHLRKDWTYPATLYDVGAKVVIGPYPINEKSPLTGLKTTNRLPNFLAFQAAREQQALEGLLKNTSGRIAEGSRSNIFWVKDDLVQTPSLAEGGLDGVTRRKVITCAERAGLLVREQGLTEKDLAQADEAFITSTLLTVMPIVKIGDAAIGDGRPGEVSNRLLQEFEKKVTEEIGSVS